MKSEKQTYGKKRSDLWLPEAGVEVGKLDEGGSKAQTSGYKIRKSRDECMTR